MDAIASLKNYRQAPRKVRLVADLVRGKRAEHALALLSMLPKRASDPMAKLIKSAIANAQNLNEGSAAADLVISKIEVNGGIVFKRSMPRARGRASAIKKKTSLITLTLTSMPHKAPKAKKVAAATN
ncbi:MAG: 50S ribosomal protein L22 [Candidatus Adlerbacteria bacterium]